MIRGYRRPNGRVGVRNVVAIIPTSVSTAGLATAIADGLGTWARATPHQMGTHPPAGARKQTERTLIGVGRHPNVGGAVVVGHGTEALGVRDLQAAIEEHDTPVRTVVVREVGGARTATARGRALATALYDEIAAAERVEIGLDELIVGVASSSNDVTSGVAAHPAIGAVSDRLVAAGGTVVMGGTAGFIGAEAVLSSRCEKRTVRDRIAQYIEYRERFVRRMGVELGTVGPTDAQRKGGLTTIEEISHGTVMMTGTAPVEVIFPYAYQLPVGRGFVLMDTPTHHVEHVVGQVAGGAQLVVRSAGRDCPPGNPIAPVITVTAHPDTARRMNDQVDVDLTDLLVDADPACGADRVIDAIEAAANGRRTAAERLGLNAWALNEVQPAQLAGTGTMT